MGYFCQFLENTYQDISIDILVYNYFGTDVFGKNKTSIARLNERFGLKLKHTCIVCFKGNYGESEIMNGILTAKLLMLSINYDVFINWEFQSKQFAKAKVNIYRCMFPPKPSDTKSHSRSNIYRKLANYVFSNCYNAYLPLSEYSEYWLNQYWPRIPCSKQYLLYPPVLNNYDVYPNDNKKNIILSVGRFFVEGHNKKQLEMVKCFIKHEKYFEGYEYHLAGALADRVEDKEYVDQIKQLTEGHPNIFLHINCSYDELKNLYKSAKIFWHATGYGVDPNENPEQMEHFGITTVEAMNFSVVPVVINAGGQSEIVNNAVNGFLWNTLDECAEYTRILISDENLRCTMAEKASMRSKDFSIQAFYRNCSAICNSIGI